jgi:hypothetical protein
VARSSASKLVDQAWKLRFLPTGHQLSPRIRMQPQLSANALQF